MKFERREDPQDLGPVILISGHGSVSGQGTIVHHRPHRIIHPCPVNLTVDVLLHNLLLKMFVTAESTQHLRALCQMLQEIPSTHTVLSNGVPENPRESQSLLQHRILPAVELRAPFVFSPRKHHDQYFAYRVFDGPSSNIQASLSVHINKIKLFEQVAGSEGDSTGLDRNHAVYLKPLFRIESANVIYLSEIIDYVLPKLVVAILRPTDFQRMRRNDLVDAMDIPLVYLECDENPFYHYEELERRISGLALEMGIEIHKVRLPAKCTVIPIICRRPQYDY